MPGSITKRVRLLYRLRNVYTPTASALKLELLLAIASDTVYRASILKTLYQSLCFIRAFPDSARHHWQARHALINFDQRIPLLDSYQNELLLDSGIGGCSIYYRFSYEVAAWLCRRCPGGAELDWGEIDDLDAIDEIVRQMVTDSELDYYDGGAVTVRDWIETAKGPHTATDFDWLMTQLRPLHRSHRQIARMYDRADIPLRWQPDAKICKGRNAIALGRITLRPDGMRPMPARPARAVAADIDTVRRLTRSQGLRAIDVAMAALATRHRETYHFNHANPVDIYAADVGQGLQILLYGLLPEYRFTLEATMGYLVVANGMPIGYGGASAVFHQINTGINLFAEYRGSEAGYVWIQVLRAYHQLTGCTQFVINPYQLGAGNKEALDSGAFWFYYRSGFRPVSPDVARVASREYVRLKKGRGRRTETKMLRQLASGDMHLRLPGARKREFFHEQWLETCAAGATGLLARGPLERANALRQAASTLMRRLGVGDVVNWSKSEHNGLLRLAPVMNLIDDIELWQQHDRRKLVQLIRAKGGESEKNYIRLMRNHVELRRGLTRYCAGVT